MQIPYLVTEEVKNSYNSKKCIAYYIKRTN